MTVLVTVITILTIQSLPAGSFSEPADTAPERVAGTADEPAAPCCASHRESCESRDSGDEQPPQREPCCPDGCKHCPRPCCSSLVMIPANPATLLAEPVYGPAFAAPQPRLSSICPDRIFHPPRA